MASRVEMVFPSYIYRGRLNGAAALNKAFAREIDQLEKMDHYGREWSRVHYPGGYSSYSSMTNLHVTSPNFGELKDKLGPHVKRFVNALKWEMRGRKLRMTTCWANSMAYGTHHTLHLHPMSVISGVYYVNLPPGSSAFKLEDPRMGLFMAAPPRKASAPASHKNYLEIKPKPGEFILFESWMRHEVPPHRGKLPRLSISFNYEI
jgi:uncharacterized protein (TIGR02466 family)